MPAPSPTSVAATLRSPFALRLAAIFALAVMIRLAARAITGIEGYWQDGYAHYADLADSIVAGKGFAFDGVPTAFRVPLYPLFIAAATWGSRSVWALLIAQAAVSAALAVIAGLIARRCYGNAAGLMAAAWCALYPYYAWHHLALVESGLFATLAAAATYLLLLLRERRSTALAVASGIVLGLALLTRSMIAPFALLALVWLLLPDGRHRWPRLAFGASLCALALLVTLTPWLMRTQGLTSAYGLGTETGQSLYAGAHPLLFADFPEKSVDNSRARIFAALRPAERAERDRYSGGNPARESDWYTAHAMVIAAADPAGYAGRALRKLAIAFAPWPAPRHGLVGDLGYAAWWTPLLLIGLAGAWRDRAAWRRNALFAAHFAGFVAVTALVWAQTSHRSYLDIYLMVLGAPVLVALLPRRWRSWLAR